MVSNVTHKGRRHAVWVGRLSPPMEVLLFLQEGGLHSQGKTEDPKGSLINCYHYFVSGVPRGASCPSRAVLYTSAFNNVFRFHRSEEDNFPLLQNQCRSGHFSAVEGKGTEEGRAFLSALLLSHPQRHFLLPFCFLLGGKKGLFWANSALSAPLCRDCSFPKWGSQPGAHTAPLKSDCERNSIPIPSFFSASQCLYCRRSFLPAVVRAVVVLQPCWAGLERSRAKRAHVGQQSRQELLWGLLVWKLQAYKKGHDLQ